MHVMVHEPFADFVFVTALRASATERATALARDAAASWIRARAAGGGLDRRVVQQLYALAFGHAVAAAPRAGARELLERRIEEALAAGKLLAIARPRRRVVMPVEQTPVLGPEEIPTSWIEIELLDDDGEPVAEEPYEVVTGDGRVRTGTLNHRGRAREEGIDPGDCKVSFPRLYEWRAA